MSEAKQLNELNCAMCAVISVDGDDGLDETGLPFEKAVEAVGSD